jgi:SsrA-binding protein
LEFINRKAYHEYYVDTRYIAGIVLRGTEVKSLRGGKLSFNDSYALFEGGELFLKSLHISEYAFGTLVNHEPMQERKLLMTKRELSKLQTKIKEKGFSLIPLRVYFDENGRVKVEIGLCRGKKAYDKRQVIKEREAKRETARIERGYNKIFK